MDAGVLADWIQQAGYEADKSLLSWQGYKWLELHFHMNLRLLMGNSFHFFLYEKINYFNVHLQQTIAVNYITWY
jgi:hypothetical protein